MQGFPERTGCRLAALATPGEDDCGSKLSAGSMTLSCDPACSAATCSGQAGHTLPDLVLNVTAATIAAGAVVAIGWLAIARLQ